MVVGTIRTAGILLFVLLASANNLTAQQKTNYSLSDFVDSARRHLPLLLQKQALVAAARGEITDTRHAFLPDAFLADELSLGTDNSIPGSYLSFGIIPSTSSGLRPANDYQSATGNLGILQTEYELVNFGLKKARIRGAGAYADLSQADLDREIYMMKWQIGKLYFDILKNQFQLGIDKQNINRYEAIYKVIEAITQSGIKAGADSSLALAELSKTRISYNQTFGEIRQLQQELSSLTGIASDRISIDTAGTSNYLPALDRLGQQSFADSIINPLTNYYSREKTVYQAAETIVKKSYLPKIMLTGTAWARGSGIDYTGDYKSTAQGLGYQRFNYMAGLLLEYDLFNGIHRKDKLAISRYNTMASDYGLQQQELTLKNASDRADIAIRTAAKNLFEMPVQINAARTAFNQKTAQYKAGIINLVDLTNASFVLYRSQSDYVQTLSDWLLANLDKAAAIGDLDFFIQTIK